MTNSVAPVQEREVPKLKCPLASVVKVFFVVALLEPLASS